MFGSFTNFETGLLDDLRRMQQELEAAFVPLAWGAGAWPTGIRSVARGSFPPINVGTTSDQVDVYLFAPGLDPKSLDISIQQSLLTVAGERKVEVPEDVQYYRQERFNGSFRRVISLPEDVDPDQVDARYTDGILQVALKRREASRPRQIQVK